MAGNVLTGFLQLLSLATVALAVITSSGREFVVVYQSTYDSNNAPGAAVSTTSTSPVTVDFYCNGVRVSSVSVTASAGTRVFLSSVPMLDTTNLYGNAAVYVNATGEISLSAFHNYDHSSDYVMVHPISSLATTYYVITTPPGGATKSQLSVVSLTSNNYIVFTFRNPSTNYGVPASAGRFTQTLNALEAYHIKTSEDLTGTLVEAQQAVAVFAGTVPEYSSFKLDQTVSQMISPDSWGSTIIVYPNPHTSFVRVITASASTRVDVNGVHLTTLTLPGDWIQVNVTSNSMQVITTSTPALATLTASAVDVNPCMTELVPEEKWLSVYTSYVAYASTEIIVVARKSLFVSIRKDGQSLSGGSCVERNYTDRTYKSCALSVSQNSSFVLDSQPANVPFIAYLRTSLTSSSLFGPSIQLCAPLGANLEANVLPTTESITTVEETTATDIQTTEATTSTVANTGSSDPSAASSFPPSDETTMTALTTAVFPDSTEPQTSTTMNDVTTADITSAGTAQVGTSPSTATTEQADSTAMETTMTTKPTPHTTVINTTPTNAITANTTTTPTDNADSLTSVETDSTTAGATANKGSEAADGTTTVLPGAMCTCSKICNVTSVGKMNTSSLHRGLLVNPTNTSAARRKLRSMPDPRIMPKVVFVIFLVAILPVLGGLVVSDCHTMAMDAKHGFKAKKRERNLKKATTKRA